METSKTQGWLPLSLYRFILTVARRSGVGSIGLKTIVTDGSEIAVLKKRGEKHHLLPYYIIEGDAEGEDVEKAIIDSVKTAGLNISRILRYLGSRNASCFYFEVLVKKKKADGLLWVGRNGMGRLNLPEEEKKALENYFDGR